MGTGFADAVSPYAALQVRHCWISLSSSGPIAQLLLLVQLDVNLVLTTDSCQLPGVCNGLCHCLDQTKLELIEINVKIFATKRASAACSHTSKSRHKNSFLWLFLFSFMFPEYIQTFNNLEL